MERGVAGCQVKSVLTDSKYKQAADLCLPEGFLMEPAENKQLISSADEGRCGPAGTSLHQACSRARLSGFRTALELCSNPCLQKGAQGDAWVRETTVGRWERETGGSRARILGSDG